MLYSRSSSRYVLYGIFRAAEREDVFSCTEIWKIKCWSLFVVSIKLQWASISVTLTDKRINSGTK